MKTLICSLLLICGSLYLNTSYAWYYHSSTYRPYGGYHYYYNGHVRYSSAPGPGVYVAPATKVYVAPATRVYVAPSPVIYYHPHPGRYYYYKP